jgi:hypothetical protein
MTEREKAACEDTRRLVFARDGYRCICGGSIYQYGTPQLAHRIPQYDYLVKKYGKAIIHHPVNLRAVCSLKCNKKVDIGRYPGRIAEVLAEIKNSSESGKLLLTSP